jgi:shikimate kinase
MNILLLGIMGSGKSSLGKKIAKHLDFNFIEQDSLILEKIDLDITKESLDTRPKNTTRNLLETRQILWKEMELESSKELSFNTNQVIACGGGIVSNDLNILYFKENSQKIKIFYLYAEKKVLLDRILSRDFKSEKHNSEFLSARLEDVLARRDMFYRDFADEVIDTSDVDENQALSSLVNHLESF